MCSVLNVVSRGNVNNQIGLLNLLRQHVVPHVHLTGRGLGTCSSTHAFGNEGKDSLCGTIHARDDKLRQVDYSRETTVIVKTQGAPALFSHSSDLSQTTQV